MNLHVDHYGSGAPLLLIHGWGMHGGMWRGVAGQLAAQFHVMAVDLPGHGHSMGNGEWKVESGKTCHHSPLPTSYSPLDSIVDQLSAQFDGPLTVCGWSLGGQLALRWAMREPEKVERLILVCSTPCFVQRPVWDCAMAAGTLAQFADALRQDYAQTLRRFLALQVRGCKDERELLAELRTALFSRGEPDMAALEGGLDILCDCDLRAALPDIRQPALVIAGERDTLTPPTAAQYLAEQMPDAKLAIIKGAAHTPFLSHPDEFVEQLISFLKDDPQINQHLFQSV